jgi:hypothetical protein
MECIISDRISDKVAKAAQSLGYDESELVNRAILYYLDSIKSNLELKSEFDSWDELSDEALKIFEKEL